MIKNFKMVIFENGNRTLENVNVKKHDDFTYIVGSVIKENNIKNIYSLVDKNTGLIVCYAKTKKTALEEYEKKKEAYNQHMNTSYYQKQTKEYNDLLKEYAERI